MSCARHDHDCRLPPSFVGIVAIGDSVSDEIIARHMREAAEIRGRWRISSRQVANCLSHPAVTVNVSPGAIERPWRCQKSSDHAARRRCDATSPRGAPGIGAGGEERRPRENQPSAKPLSAAQPSKRRRSSTPVTSCAAKWLQSQDRRRSADRPAPRRSHDWKTRPLRLVSTCGKPAQFGGEAQLAVASPRPDGPCAAAAAAPTSCQLTSQTSTARVVEVAGRAAAPRSSARRRARRPSRDCRPRSPSADSHLARSEARPRPHRSRRRR